MEKLGTSAHPAKRTKSQRKLTKEDTVIFAAILMDLKGMKYCAFLHNYGIKPRWPDWSESGTSTYQNGYKVGDPWRKKIQDQKTRAKQRMHSYSASELATAVNAYLPDKFDQISPLINSRNSLNASKTSAR